MDTEGKNVVVRVNSISVAVCITLSILMHKNKPCSGIFRIVHCFFALLPKS